MTPRQSYAVAYPPDPDGLSANGEGGRDREREVASRIYVLLRDRVVRDPSGTTRSPHSIAARLIVLLTLLDPSTSTSLAVEARTLGVSREYLSRIGRAYQQELGLPAPPKTNGCNAHTRVERANREWARARAEAMAQRGRVQAIADRAKSRK